MQRGGRSTKAFKILLLTASIGSGHIKAAEAIERELRGMLPQADITTVDFMSRQTSWLHWLMKKIYLIMLDFVPNLYDVFYKVSGGASGGSLAQSAFAVVMQPVVKRIIREAVPDIVICTHPFPEGAVSLWKKRHDTKLPLVVVMTDYSLHQIWLYPRVEAYFMATEAMRQEMIEKEFSQASLHAAGIPVAASLQELPGKTVLRDSYGLPQNNPVLYQGLPLLHQ